jgi:hemolysin D
MNNSLKKESTDTEPISLNDFSTAATMLGKQPPFWVARMISLSLCAMAAIALLYAFFAHIDIVVSAQGHVIPTDKSKAIQSLEAGLVKAIHVRDGEKVKAGQLLLELDPTLNLADRDRLQRELWETEADVLRVQALLDGKSKFVGKDSMPEGILHNQQAMLDNRYTEQRAKLSSMDADIARRKADRDAIETNLQQIKQSLPLVKKKNDMREDLAKVGHISETGLIETRLELSNAEKEIAVQTNRLEESKANLNASIQQRAQAVAEFRGRTSTELVEAIKKHDAAEQELIKANQRKEMQALKAPIDGVVQQLTVTTIGGVVTQAQQLMVIVPETAPLEVEAQVLNKDVGHISKGQRVINKVETYDFTRYGYIEGEVLWVGKDAVTDQKLGTVYPVRIKLNQTQLPNIVRGNSVSVSAGMNITADIKTDERRMVEYFLAPMLRYKEESLRER